MALKGVPMSDETKQKLSKANSGENHPRYGKHCSEETKKKIGLANSGRLKGRKLSVIHKERITINSCNKGRFGKLSPMWKGGITRKNGYVMIWKKGHPYAYSNYYMLEHRLIMEKKLGRYLFPWEVVHHKNGIRDDNRIENLELLPSGRHNKIVQEVYKENLFLKEQLANFMNIRI